MENNKNVGKIIPEPLMFIHTVSTPILSNGSKRYFDSRQKYQKAKSEENLQNEFIHDRNHKIDQILLQKIQNIVQMNEKGYQIPCLIETRKNESSNSS